MLTDVWYVFFTSIKHGHFIELSCLRIGYISNTILIYIRPTRMSALSNRILIKIKKILLRTCLDIPKYHHVSTCPFLFLTYIFKINLDIVYIIIY
ncbi:uncharacterized protein DS421_16g559550 [Arachis hypogaea]|nr:uncharacterized protein DS421_16g559550 [Arachis hypogaea]